MSPRAEYGIDAPLVVRNLLLAAGFLFMAAAVVFWIQPLLWTFLFSAAVPTRLVTAVRM